MRAFIVAMLIPAAAYADGHELSLGGGSRALRSSSADAVTGDGLGTGALGYAYHLDIPQPVPGSELWLEGSFEWGGATGQMFQTIDTKIGMYAGLVGAHAKYDLLRLVSATARLDVGTARTSLSLNDGSGSYSDSGWGLLAHGALGLDAYAVRGPGFSFGVRAELGYTVAQPVALTPHSDRSDNTLKLDMTDASIGHLDLSGPGFAVSLLGEF